LDIETGIRSRPLARVMTTLSNWSTASRSPVINVIVRTVVPPAGAGGGAAAAGPAAPAATTATAAADTTADAAATSLRCTAIINALPFDDSVIVKTEGASIRVYMYEHLSADAGGPRRS
jgi:hypothetical protein